MICRPTSIHYADFNTSTLYLFLSAKKQQIPILQSLATIILNQQSEHHSYERILVTRIQSNLVTINCTNSMHCITMWSVCSSVKLVLPRVTRLLGYYEVNLSVCSTSTLRGSILFQCIYLGFDILYSNTTHSVICEGQYFTRRQIKPPGLGQ